MDSIDVSSSIDESDQESVPRMSAVVDTGSRMVTLSWTEALPVVPRGWSGTYALQHACVPYELGEVNLNPHALAAAFRFTARNRLKTSVAKCLEAYSTVFGIASQDFESEVIALYPSGWESKVLVFETDNPDRPVTRCATFRDDQWASDRARNRALGTDKTLDNAMVAVAFDVYHLSPERVFELFKTHRLALDRKAGRPGARLYVVGRYFPQEDGSVYVDTFPTKDDPYMEGFGVVQDGVVEFRASQGEAHDSEYTHTVRDNHWLFTQTRYVQKFKDDKTVSYMDVGLHRDWVVGPYVCVTLSIKIYTYDRAKSDQMALFNRYFGRAKAQRQSLTPPRNPHHLVKAGLVPSLLPYCFQQVSGMDERNQAALSSAHRAAVRELVKSLGFSGYNRLCEQTWGGVEGRYLVNIVVPSVLRTLEMAMASVNGLPVALPDRNVWRAAVIEARSRELQHKLGLGATVAETLATGAVASRFEFALSAGSMLWSAAAAAVGACRSFWCRLLDEFRSRLGYGIAAGNGFAAIFSGLRRLWAATGMYVETKIGRVRNLLNALTLFDWLPFLDRDMNLELNGVLILVSGVVFEELLKHTVPTLAVVWTAVEFAVWVLRGVSGDLNLPLDEVLALRIAVLLMHVLCFNLPIGWGLLVHGMWNLAAQAVEKAGMRVSIESLRKRTVDQIFTFVPPEGAAPIAVPTFPAVNSSLRAENDLGQEVSVEKLAEEEDPLVETQPRRFKWFDAPVSQCFGQPASTISSASVVVGTRLDAAIPLPRPSVVSSVNKDFEYATRYVNLEETWKPFGHDDMVLYIQGSLAWSTGRKRELVDVLEKIKRGVTVPEKKEIFTKTDELLLLKFIEDVWRLKVRPIHPMDLSHFVEMMAVVPFKSFLSRTWYVERDNSSRMRYTLEHTERCVGSITYMSDPTPGKKDAWATEYSQRFGVHCLAHGDDEITFICGAGDQETLAEASDLGSCDLTCHEEYQKAFLEFRHRTCDDPDMSRHLMAQYMSSLTGKFKYTVASLNGRVRLVYTKENASTNTGHPATAQLAFGVQFVLFPTLMSKMPTRCRGVTASLMHFMNAKRKLYRDYGLKPEPEESDNHAMSSHSFLASIPVPVGDRVTWASFAFVKTFLFYPDPIKVWGKAGTPGHVAAIYLTDPMIDSTPLHRAFGRFWRRMVEFHGVRDFDEVVETWLSWLGRLDPYRAELERAARKESKTASISDEFFFSALEKYVSGWSKDSERIISDVHRLIDELDACNVRYPSLTDCSLVLVKLRYRDDQARLLETDLGGVFQGSVVETVRGSIKFLGFSSVMDKKNNKKKAAAKNVRAAKSDKVALVAVEAHKPKTVTRVSHVPMQSVKSIKMGPAIAGSTTYSTLDYSINAGNSDLWPRLAQVAKTYQFWRCTNWSVRYEPIASMFGANKSGVVTISMLENWYDAIPDTMTAQTERAKRSITIPAWESGTLKLDPSKWKYVRDSAGSQGQDMRLDDEIVEVGVEGTDAASVGAAIGYLYLTADVEFKIPYTVSLLNPPRTNGVFTIIRNNDVNLASSPTGVSTGLGYSGGTTLNNSAYTGVRMDSGTAILTGGTYNCRCSGTFACASTPAYVFISWAATGHSQLIQQEGSSSRLGVELTLSTVNASSLTGECVVTVPEGGSASIVPTVMCIQASSTNVVMYGTMLTIIPH